MYSFLRNPNPKGKRKSLTLTPLPPFLSSLQPFPHSLSISQNGPRASSSIKLVFLVSCEFMNYFVFYLYVVYKTTSEVIILL